MAPRTVVFILCACFATFAAPAGEDDAFARPDLPTRHVLVVADDAPPALLTAAGEIQQHVALVAGEPARPRVVRAGDYNGGAAVFIGRSPALTPALAETAAADLGEEEILLARDGEHALLLGGTPRATLYAAYEWLHQLGVRFYDPAFTKLPPGGPLALPRPFRHKPDFFARSLLIGNGPAGDPATLAWTARNRLTSVALWRNPGEAYGGGRAEGPDMHTFWRMIRQPDIDAHPDWAALVNGRRLPPAGNIHWGLCLKPEVRAFLIGRTLRWARENPDKEVVWVGQNDGSPACECDYCSAIYAEHGGHKASIMVITANELGEALEREFPGRRVKFLAYAWTVEPPPSPRLRDNVSVMFCATSDFVRSFATDPRMDTVRRWADGWTAIADNVCVYAYAYPFHDYWVPTPSLYPQAENLEWYRAVGVNDVYMHVSGFGDAVGSEAVDLRAWAYARKLWDVDADFKALVAEYCADNYGAAAPAALAALDRLHRDVFDDAMNIKVKNDAFRAPSYSDPEALRLTNRELEAARAGLEGDELRRFDLFRVPYLWGDVWAHFRPGEFSADDRNFRIPMGDDPETARRYAVEAKRLMRENNITGLSEHLRGHASSFPLDLFGVDWPARRLTGGDAEITVVPGVGGNLMRWRLRGLEAQPLKKLWYLALIKYPLMGSWYDHVDHGAVTNYQLVVDQPDRVLMRGRRGPVAVDKQVVMDRDGAVTVTLTATNADHAGFDLRTSLMFDMRDHAFGLSPTVWVEKKEGAWTPVTLGEGLGDFWYQGMGVDLADATGRLVVQGADRPWGVAFTVDPDAVTVSCEYDRYLWKEQPEYSCMFNLFLVAKAPGEGKEKGTRVLTVRGRIVADAQALRQTKR